MQSHISGLEILNLPSHGYKTQWRVGDRIDLDGKRNLLFIGSNGTGKSTMLQVLHESLERAKKILRGVNTLKMAKHPYDVFAFHFDGYTWKVNPYGHESELTYTEEQYEEDLLSGFYYGLEGIYGNGITNFWDDRYRSSPQHLHDLILSYVKVMNQDAGYEGYKGGGEAFDAAQDSFHIAAKLFAEKEGIIPEVVYGNLVLILEGNHGKLLNGASQWGYIKPEGNEEKILSTPIVTLDNSEPKGESLGEKSKRVLEEVQSCDKRVLALLDEPTNGLDRKSRSEIRKAILEMKANVQIVASSHDDGIIDGALESEDWEVYDLDEK